MNFRCLSDPKMPAAAIPLRTSQPLSQSAHNHYLARCLPPRHDLKNLQLKSPSQRSHSHRKIGRDSCDSNSPGGRGGDRGRGRGRGGGRGGGRGRGGGGGRGRGRDNNTGPDPDGEDGEGGGLFKRRSPLPQNFDRNAVDSVLSEWMKSRKDLPFDLQVAGLTRKLSSSKLTRYLSFRKGPGLIECLVKKFLWCLRGRDIADPNFRRKLIFQFVASASSYLWWEIKNRPKKSHSLWKSALTAGATQSFVVWLLASCCNYSPLARQSCIPNNIFETNYEFKEFGVGQRMLCLICSGVKMFLLGTLVKTTEIVGKGGHGLNSGITIFRNGMYFGVNCNLRYQILCGLDRIVVDYFDNTEVALALCSLFRASNAWIGAKMSLKYVVESQTDVDAPTTMATSNNYSLVGVQ